MDQIWFWVAATFILAIVVAVLLQALRRGREEVLYALGTEDIDVYREQLIEVDRDLARGVLHATEAERLRNEIGRRLLAADARSTKDHRHRYAGRDTGSTVAFVIVQILLALLTSCAIVIYLWLGAPGYADLPMSERLALSQQAYDNRPSQAKAEEAAPKLDAPADVDPQMMQLIEKLRAVVKDHPDDPKGLAFLAKYEASLGNFAAAEAAQTHLIKVKGDTATAEDHAGLAELMIMSAGGVVTPEAEAQLIAALKLDPANPPARYYSGLMFLQVDRPDRTFDLWEALLRESRPEAPWTAPIRDQLEGVAAAAGIRYALPAEKGPTAQDMATASQMSPEDRQAMIETMVGGLETRLMQDGGPIEDWTRLVDALGVLGQTERAQAAYDRAKTTFAANPGDLSALQAAAVKAGITP